jgi:carboxypeptidase C (cathepsin A)
MAKPSFVVIGGTPESLALSDAAASALAGAVGSAAGAASPTPAPRPAPVITEHDGLIGGRTQRYRATVGTLPLREGGEGKTKADIFFIAYELIAPDAGERRPVTFVFNGGPGSSSIWLHMGALGPRRVKLDPEGRALPGEAQVVDNEFGWLDMTDLVFIDPVSTGLSRAAAGEDAKQFHGLDEDVKAIGEFIRLYLTRQQRWGSPKYLAGESYGATRAAALAKHLQADMGVYLSGITLVSPALDFQVLSFDHCNDIAYPMFLPTYTATALYHDAAKVPAGKTAAMVIKEAEQFAIAEYLPALAAGSALPAAKAAAVAERLSAFTGLSAAFWLRKHLRLRDEEFFAELLRERGKTVGRLDTRFTCDAVVRSGATDVSADPSYAAILGAFSTALHTHLLGTLKYPGDGRYEILYLNLEHWNYNAPNRYVTTAPHLLHAMIDNPQLQVLVCGGWYDAATPHFASDHSVSHLCLYPSLAGRIKTTYYECGHMVYLREADLAKFKADAAAMYTR